MFERTKAKIRLHRICKALGVEPYPEMVRYVIDRDETIFRGGRRNGKTLALIIDELVYKRIPPTLLGCPNERAGLSRPFFISRGRARYGRADI